MSVNPEIAAYSAGIRADADEVWEGRSKYPVRETVATPVPPEPERPNIYRQFMAAERVMLGDE